MRTIFHLFLVLFLLLGIFFCGCSSKQHSNLLFITIHSLRPDHLSCYGYGRETSPHIDQLAKEGVLFENAYSVATLTPPSLASIFTGTFPFYHGVRSCGEYALGEEQVTLGEIFKERKYSTAGISSSPFMEKRYGFQQGFDSYLAPTPVVKSESQRGRGRKKSKYDLVKSFLNGQKVQEEAVEWLEKQGTSPFFLWVHFSDLHPPYAPPPPYDTLFPSPYMEDDFEKGDDFIWDRMSNPNQVAYQRSSDPDYLEMFYEVQAGLMDRMVPS